MAKRTWHAYVYALTYQDQILYIGKGTGNRLKGQRYNFGLTGHELAWFKTEQDAYTQERQLIAEYSPPLNKHPGGNGSWSVPKPVPRLTAEDKDPMLTRIHAIAILARFTHGFSRLFLGGQRLPIDPAEVGKVIGQMVKDRGEAWVTSQFARHKIMLLEQSTQPDMC